MTDADRRLWTEVQINRDSLEDYVKTLLQRLQEIFIKADREILEAADTSEDSFQIAAEVDSIFRKYAKRREEGRT